MKKRESFNNKWGFVLACIGSAVGIMIKGYFVTEGYMGYVDGRYQLFADETDYIEYMEE